MPNDTEKALTQTALRYLSYRDRFKKEIELRLKKQIVKQKLPEESLSLIPNILTKLEETGLINDQELIDTYIKYQQESKLRGPYFIKQKLLRMGAPNNIIDTSLRRLITSKSQDISIEKLYKKHQPNLEDRKDLERFQRQLMYKGFNINQIKKKIALLTQKE